MRPIQCLYGNCKYTSKTARADDISFVPFPKPLNRRAHERVQRWLDACGRLSITVSFVEKSHNRCFLCATHFVGRNGPTNLCPDPIYFQEEEPLPLVCCVTDCGSVSSRDILTTFYPIPQDDDQLQKRWRDALKLGPGFLPDDLHVCSKHFISGLKSNFHAHPDYVPSILPSSTVHEIKALRNALREFENGSAEQTMKYNCKSLRRHWFECGFTSKDLQDGMKRVKAVKRAQERTKHQERLILKAVRLKRKVENKLKQKQGSELDEEFVIENERAEEPGEDCHDFNLSVVKQEPMSESSVDIRTEDNQLANSGSLCSPEDEDTELSSSKGENFCSVEQMGQDSISENDTCAFTVVREDGKVMMSEKGIKTEPEDDGYEKAKAPAVNRKSQDFSDEMLCIPFAGQKVKMSHVSDCNTSDMLNKTLDVGESQRVQEGQGPEKTPSNFVLMEHTVAQEQENNISATRHASIYGAQASSTSQTPAHIEANPDTFTSSDSALAPSESEDPNSKMCQTKKSISKEYTCKKSLEKMEIQLTSSEMKRLLKDKMDPRGICPSFQRSGRVVVHAGVQSITDKVVLHDLNRQCARLNREVMQHRKKLKSLTYDFLDEGSKVNKQNVLSHTGCYSFATLVDLYEHVSVCLETPPLDDISDSKEFILTLMKLRLGLHNYDLAFRFQIDPTNVPRILNKWISIFFNTLSPLIVWPESEPKRIEHRNERWRQLKLRYYLLMAYDGIDSMKDDWLMDQNMDEIIKICDVLNSFIVLEKTVSNYIPILPETSSFFIEQTKLVAAVGGKSAIEKSQETHDSETIKDNITNEPKCTENEDNEIDKESISGKTNDIEKHIDSVQTQNGKASTSSRDVPQRVSDDIEQKSADQESLQKDSTESSKYTHQKKVSIFKDVQLRGKESGCKIMASSVRVITKSRGMMIGCPIENVEVETTPWKERATLLDMRKVFSIIADD